MSPVYLDVFGCIAQFRLLPIHYHCGYEGKESANSLLLVFFSGCGTTLRYSPAEPRIYESVTLAHFGTTDSSLFRFVGVDLCPDGVLFRDPPPHPGERGDI